MDAWAGAEMKVADLQEQLRDAQCGVETELPRLNKCLDNHKCQRSMYGAGVYFTRTDCSQHTSCCRCDCERTLIIARLTLGDAVLATETRYDERRPPVRNK